MGCLAIPRMRVAPALPNNYVFYVLVRFPTEVIPDDGLADVVKKKLKALLSASGPLRPVGRAPQADGFGPLDPPLARSPPPSLRRVAGFSGAPFVVRKMECCIIVWHRRSRCTLASTSSRKSRLSRSSCGWRTRCPGAGERGHRCGSNSIARYSSGLEGLRVLHPSWYSWRCRFATVT